MKIIMKISLLMIISIPVFAYNASCEVEYGHGENKNKETIQISTYNGMLKTKTSFIVGYSKFLKKYNGRFIYQDENGLITELEKITNGKFSYDYDGYAFGTCPPPIKPSKTPMNK